MKYDIQNLIALTLILALSPISAPASERGDGILEATKPQSLDAAKQASADRWQKLLKDWKTERNKLNSGSVVIKGEDDLSMISRSESGESKEKKIQKSFQLQGTFDYELGLQKWVASNYLGYSKTDCTCIIAPDGVTTWCSNSEPNTRPKHINIWDLDAKLPSYAIYWYPLTAGFSRISSGGNASLAPYGLWYKRFQKQSDLNSNDSIDFSTDEATGLTRVKIKTYTPVNNLPCIIFNDLLFNEKQGITLVSHTLWIYPKKYKQPKTPFYEVKVEWEQISSVWVPTSVSKSSSGGKRKRELELSWNTINEPVDANVLQVGAPEGTTIVDLRQNTK